MGNSPTRLFSDESDANAKGDGRLRASDFYPELQNVTQKRNPMEKFRPIRDDV